MAVQPIIVPRFRWSDSNGEPLAGGLLYSYEAGTTTPLATYTTRAGDVANANPVVLDANGEADVWVTGGTLYKFVLKDSAGVTLWTEDNVPSSEANTALADGSVSAPALSFSADINTGIYRPGADQLAVAVGGAQAALFATGGASFPLGLAADLDCNGKRLTDLGAPTSANDAARKADVDAALVAKASARVHVTSAGVVTIRSNSGFSGIVLSAGAVVFTLATAAADANTLVPVPGVIHTTVSDDIVNAVVVSASVINVNLRDTAGTDHGFGTGFGDRECSLVVFDNPA